MKTKNKTIVTFLIFVVFLSFLAGFFSSCEKLEINRHWNCRMISGPGYDTVDFFGTKSEMEEYQNNINVRYNEMNHTSDIKYCDCEKK